MPTVLIAKTRADHPANATIALPKAGPERDWRGNSGTLPSHRSGVCQLSDGLEVLDLVAVALLGQEELAVVGKLLIHCVVAHERVEVRLAAIRLGAEDASEAL